MLIQQHIWQFFLEENLFSYIINKLSTNSKKKDIIKKICQLREERWQRGSHILIAIETINTYLMNARPLCQMGWNP